ncbi:MAG: hypothetical protein EOM20_21050, partial [Spartobacteria bacterium]|nr:hypothetical protein [Spartobacteria bacterium]
MTLQPELFKAILAMDAYNRGYDASISTLPTNTTGSAKIGTATITATSTEELGNGVDSAIGFYALAYGWDSDGDGTADETIIAYRGTDYPVTDEKTVDVPLVGDVPVDIYHGWSLGGGLGSEQGQMAVEFYQQVVGAENTLTADVSFTGHSLGGGLSGYLGSLYGKEADVFDSMTFAQAADNTYAMATEYEAQIAAGNTHKVTYASITDPLLLPYTAYTTESGLQGYRDSPFFLIYEEKNLLQSFETGVYGNEDAWAPNDSLVDGYYMSKEILNVALFRRDGAAEDGGKYWLGEDREFFNLIEEPFWQNAAVEAVDIAASLITQKGTDIFKSIADIGSNLANEGVALHSMSTLVIRMAADDPAVNGYGDIWKHAAPYFWPVLYDG